MGERHVEELFSAAYDDALSDSERARYDAHLAGCERCTAAAAEFRAAIDAVRALPQAQMPVRVVLPATPPVAERRSLLPWLRLPVLSPATGGAVMALAGIAAVVVAVHVHGGGGASTTAGSVPFGALAPQAQDQLNRARSGGVGNSLADIGACPKPLAVTSAQPGVASAGNPAGFSNRVAVRNPQRPGQELVLATTSSRYAPGAQVLVFAALTTSGGQHTVVVPCVALQQLTESLGAGAAASAAQTGSATATAAAGGGASGNGAPPAAVALPKSAAGSINLYGYYSELGGVPLAIAIPTSQSVAGTLPVQVVTIPDSVPHGTVLHLVALIPAGVPGASDKPAIEAVLTLDVS